MAFDPYCTSSFLLDTYRHEISVPTSKPTIKKRRKATKPTKQQKSQSDNMPVPPSPAPVVGTTPVTVAANALAPPLREAALSLADNALKVAEPDGQDDGSWVAAAPIPRVQVIEKRKRTLSDFNKPEEVKKARRDEGLEAKGKQREILGAEGHSPPSPQLETCPAGNDDSDGLVDPATRAYMDNILAHISASAAAVDLDEASSYNKENWFDRTTLFLPRLILRGIRLVCQW
ncbi:hypothetical protein BDZ89DRAFT_247861 [Hymenopellis radicata]|nr:hypothetical protein BDZ89DRAFT_247861 [Hymenopellis radicata]